MNRILVLLLSAAGFLPIMACGVVEGEDSASDEAALRRATTLTCTSVARAYEDASLSPRFTMTARVSAQYHAGAELTGLTNVRAGAGRPSNAEKAFASVAKDGAYRPRGNKNRNRFSIESLDATDESFDGIVHSVILPKKLGPADIDSSDNDHIVFHAVVASSTDSFHDGIISYFKMRCELSPANGDDYLTCASRVPESSEDASPSFTFTATTPLAFANGGELTSLKNLSASAAQEEPTRWNTINSDASYRPRTELNRNRFKFPAGLDVSDDSFDGISHGLLLPKKIAQGTRSFTGYLISSTDSYHDGIMSYFPMTCRLGQ